MDLTNVIGQDGHHSHDRHYELRFQSLFREGRAWAFPCDAQGHVDLDALSERARCNYWFVRTSIGREVDVPRVRQLLL